MSWRVLSRAVESKGLTVAKAKSLSDLHRRREETQAQFFTPEWVSLGIWASLAPVMQQARSKGVKWFSVVDSSVGAGRLFEGAPVDCKFFGLDIDPVCIDALGKDAEVAGIHSLFMMGSIADLEIRNMHIAVINPPYSIHLDSPNLFPYDCTSFGKYGPCSASLSHFYALDQALDAARVVAAVLPVSMAATCRSKPSLSLIVNLPSNTFKHEGANVQTAVYFFSATHSGPVKEVSISATDKWPELSGCSLTLPVLNKPKFTLEGVELSEPVITLPVTGNNRVELHHHNRKIVLKYRCGLTQAKVANGLLERCAKGLRLPKAFRYRGDGQFLLDVLLLQDDPRKAFQDLLRKIRALGGDPWVSPTLSGYFEKLIKKHQRAIVPMFREVLVRGGGALKIKAIKRTLLEPGNFDSPSIAKDQILTAVPTNGEYVVNYEDWTVSLRRDELVKRFAIADDASGADEAHWEVKHKGLNAAFPSIAHQHGKQIDRAGINWLAPFQRCSLIEGLISPVGYIGAWEQGSGKARYALALSLMHSGKNMLVVESGLLPEMMIELEKIKLPKHLWKVLINGDAPTAKLNIVTYATLRQGTTIRITRTKRIGKEDKVEVREKIVRTNAARWRRQVNTLICDEGGLLANLNTQQTQAVKRLCARKVIVLDGTPQRNYPRDLLPLSVATAGNGVAHQPFGVKTKPFLEKRLLDSADESRRGEDEFFDRHVVTQWVTHQFMDELQTGGKREVPKINNLALFRGWLAPNIQRRLRDEPDLAIFKNCARPNRETYICDWDRDHFGHYLKVAIEFAHWYRQAKESSKALNLVTVLARIGAVQRAASSPHVSTKSTMRTYHGITSKQRFAMERVKHWLAEGRKVILYARSPEVLERFHSLLKADGIESVLFTGKQDIEQRTAEMDSLFRYGPVNVLLSSRVGSRGQNLEQAGAVILYERDFSATAEEQTISRTQRPAQTLTVEVEYLHLAGGIDDYCAQLVEWKMKAADAGLDFGEQADEEEEFQHLDTLLVRFCEETLKMSLHDAANRYAA